MEAIEPSMETTGMLLAGLVAITSVLLIVGQRRERTHRESDLDEIDARYFRRRDVRRVFGSGLMLLLAWGLWTGSRTPVRVHGLGNPSFVRIWFGVIVLLFCLLGAALLDWLDTFIYARRQHRSLTDQRLELIRGHWSRRAQRGERSDDTSHPNGRPGGL